MLNIRTLQILVEVARQGGFSRAAQTVHAVQPTVSKAVQAVEDRLGVRIFERANNGVRLTVEGEIVYRRALNILQEFEALEADVAALHKLEKGVLRIGFPPVASGILFADLLSKYRQLYPGINISLQEQGCASLEPMVLSGDLDLAVTLLPVPPNFSWLQIRDEPLMVIMPPDHPLADRKRLKMDELADNAFIGFEQGFLLNDRIEAVCRQRGLKLNECLRSGQLDFIMTLVATASPSFPALNSNGGNSPTSTSPFSTKRNSVGAPPSSGDAGPSCPPPRRHGSSSSPAARKRWQAKGSHDGLRRRGRSGRDTGRFGIDAFPKDATFFSSKTAPPSRRNREPQSPSLPESNTDKSTASSFKKAAPGNRQHVMTAAKNLLRRMGYTLRKGNALQCERPLLRCQQG